MKSIIATIALLLPLGAFADTYITYDDGTVYTLTDNQDVYLSSKSSTLFKRKVMGNKDTFFLAQDPWTTRDYEAPTTDGLQVGSHAWCKAFEPWAAGLTFDQVSFNQVCDTDGDGDYGCGDSQFDDSDDGSVCSN